MFLRRSKVALTAVAISGVVAAMMPAAAGAHAAFLESTPAAGSRVESSPVELRLEFTEPLVGSLTEVNIRTAGGKSVPAAVAVVRELEVIARPSRPLARGGYRVAWRTVSTRDGHTLEGSFSFGVRAEAPSQDAQVTTSPLARSGWIRILLRIAAFLSLFFFAGGVFIAVLAGRDRRLARWLAPDGSQDTPRYAALREQVQSQAAMRTRDAGFVAVASATAIAVAEAIDAAGGFDAAGMTTYLISNPAGFARLSAVFYIAIAVGVLRRAPLGAATATAAAFFSFAIGGHASAADPRAAAVGIDWLHLLAGSIWVGGLLQIAFAWAGPALRERGALDRALVINVLTPFGRIAAPAFLTTISTGVLGALTQLGGIEKLWTTDYGRLLTIKVAIVTALALISFLHVFWLRPRLGSGGSTASATSRRHWRSIVFEPFVVVPVIAITAVLVAFPLPPRQFSETQASETARCAPCPQRAAGRNELAVAARAGRLTVAGWFTEENGARIGEVRLLGVAAAPVEREMRIAGASRVEPCGIGCRRFEIERGASDLRVSVEDRDQTHRAILPIVWEPAGNRRARALLSRVEREMRLLRSVREREETTSGPGSSATIDYRVVAPDRFSFTTDRDAEAVIVGERQWSRVGTGPWSRQTYGAGLQFKSAQWFRWTPYARAVRLVSVHRSGTRRLAELALFDQATPLWQRLTIDLDANRVTRVLAVASGHFMIQRFSHFNNAGSIRIPRADIPRSH